MYKFVSLTNITAGLVAVVVGFTSSVAIIFQAASASGANFAEMSSWLLALGIGMGITSIGLSLYYRIPILIAWSTPGAALLASSLSGVPLPQVIGAFTFSAILILLAGVSGLFERAMRYIPKSLASAMLAGILLHFGINVFISMQNQFNLAFTMFIAYLIGKRFFPRYAIIQVLLLSILIGSIEGLFHLQHFHITLSSPVFIMPSFSWHVLISIGIPLFIVTMTSQNIPGITIMRASGYNPPVSSIISWTGISNLLIAPFGGFALNMAAITAAICLSKEADPDPTNRYKASIYAGIFYLIVGLFGATVVTLFAALPKELVLVLAGLALFGTIGASLQSALEDEAQREPALITLLVSASGISFCGISAAFWGLVAGILALIFLNLFK